MKGDLFACLFICLAVCSCGRKASEYVKPKSAGCEERALKNQFIVFRGYGKVELLNHVPQDNDYLFYEPNYQMQVLPSESEVVINPSNRMSTLNEWEDFGAVRYWNQGFEGQNIIVAVVDSGVNPNFPGLGEQMYVNGGDSSFDGVDNDGNSFIDDVSGWNFENNSNEVIDEVGHGSSVAYIIAAGSNSIAGSGIAPKAKIMPVDFIGSHERGGTEYDAIKAINYSIEEGANIINNSWSSPCSRSIRSMYPSWSRSGVLFIHAAGNESEDISELPYNTSNTDLANFLVVGSIDRSNRRSLFSSFGPTVDIYAWGEQILVPDRDLDSQSLRSVSGSSFSAAVVSGAAALVWSAHPDWRAEQVKDFLTGGAKMIHNGYLPVLHLSGGETALD